VVRGAYISHELALVPLFDLLHFGAQFAPYLDDRVT